MNKLIIKREDEKIAKEKKKSEKSSAIIKSKPEVYEIIIGFFILLPMP